MSEPLKIAVLSPVAWRTPPRHYGPWEQMASNLCEGLVAAGHSVTLFATGESITAGRLDAVVAEGYEDKPGQDAKVLECLHISNLMEKADQFDLIHNHFDFLPLTYSRLINTPMVTTIHGFSSEQIVPVYKKYDGHVKYVSISMSDRHASLSYAATIYNGIAIADFDFVEEADDYLLFFGRIHPHKGASEAIDIALQTGKELIIAGIIQDRSYFEQKIEPRLSDQIRYVGSAGPKDRNSLLGRAACLLHPISFDEPFGLSVAEAMACGTPVIAFNRGSMPELIEDGKTGFLVNDVDEAAKTVRKLSQLDRSYCRQRAVDRFSTEKMVADYISLYKQLL
ncbi:glycosyltransferase family 4 protein [Pedobacter sp. SYP-B3415]|uniref:glycosyltransferase family 4 protein n=1 Tax=Pedobacter sp. SYP-B3415 TaxID=2496641 RepID=UPI00101BC19E|nr:glycosyltransferase family 4 protein [Pedobacter sp. SYP-B3415]